MFTNDSTEYVVMVGRRFLRQSGDVVIVARQVEHAWKYKTAAAALNERDAIRAKSKKPVEVYSITTKRVDR